MWYYLFYVLSICVIYLHDVIAIALGWQGPLLVQWFVCFACFLSIVLFGCDIIWDNSIFSFAFAFVGKKGPLFENQDDILTQENKDGQNAEEVRALQRYLKRFGYYDDELDGSYGPITEKAVKIYQTATGTLESDGLAGPLTKASIRSKRRCSNKDAFGDNNVKDDMIDEKDESNMYGGDKNLTYNIGVCPGYLSRKATEDCINKSFKLWSDATGNQVKFNMIDDDAKMLEQENDFKRLAEKQAAFTKKLKEGAKDITDDQLKEHALDLQILYTEQESIRQGFEDAIKIVTDYLRDDGREALIKFFQVKSNILSRLVLSYPFSMAIFFLLR